MKRFSAFGLILLILFCFAGCSDDTSLESYVDEAEYIELSEGSWTVGEDIKPGHYQDVAQARKDEPLGAGCYVVGLDIPAGDYAMKSVNPEGPGQIYHYDRKGENLSQNELFDVIDADHDVGLTLQEGDRVVVSNVNQVVLEDV